MLKNEWDRFFFKHIGEETPYLIEIQNNGKVLLERDINCEFATLGLMLDDSRRLVEKNGVFRGRDRLLSAW